MHRAASARAGSSAPAVNTRRSAWTCSMTEPGSDAKIGAPRRSWPHWRGIALAAGVAVLGIAAIVGLREPPPDVPPYDLVEADAFSAALPPHPLRTALAPSRPAPAPA